MRCSLDIVVVNWNAGPRLRACLDSIAAAAAGIRLGRVVVVDNASRDGSAEGLEAVPLPLSLPLPLEVIRNPDNRGFAVASNQGAAGSTADWLLFLNPDVRLFPGALDRPLAWLAGPGRDDVGLLGIRLVGRDGRTARSCARFPTPGRLVAHSLGLDRLWPRRFPPHFMTEWDHADSREVDQVMGAFLLVRRPVFEALGGFDERFFLYYEDVDLALRARRSGWRSWYFAGARAEHYGGGTTERVRATRLFYLLRSRIQYAFKQFGPLGGAAVTAAALLGEPAARLALALARRSAVQAGEVLGGCGRLWAELPAFLPPAIMGAVRGRRG